MEVDSADWLEWLSRQNGPFLCSELVKVELAFALAQKERRGEIFAGTSLEIFQDFLGDVRQGRFRMLPIDSIVLQKSVSLALGSSARPLPLRTLDGIHLATALAHNLESVATADLRMTAAAQGVGLHCEDPRRTK
jgi:predicted nucleic acid-binding protein